MNEIKAQITLPFVILLVIGILIALVAIYILYLFLPNLSSGVQYVIYSVKSMPSTTEICSNFNYTNIKEINITTSSSSSTVTSVFQSNQIIGTELVNKENCLIFNEGYSVFASSTLYPTIVSGYVLLNNGNKQTLNFDNSNYVSEIVSTSFPIIPYVNLTVSPYIVIEPNSISATAVTNIANPSFSFFINNEQVSNCQETQSTTCLIEVSNFANNTNVEIKVYATNSIATAFNRAYIFVTNQ